MMWYSTYHTEWCELLEAMLVKLLLGLDFYTNIIYYIHLISILYSFCMMAHQTCSNYYTNQNLLVRVDKSLEYWCFHCSNLFFLRSSKVSEYHELSWLLSTSWANGQKNCTAEWTINSGTMTYFNLWIQLGEHWFWPGTRGGIHWCCYSKVVNVLLKKWTSKQEHLPPRWWRIVLSCHIKSVRYFHWLLLTGAYFQQLCYCGFFRLTWLFCILSWK